MKTDPSNVNGWSFRASRRRLLCVHLVGPTGRAVFSCILPEEQWVSLIEGDAFWNPDGLAMDPETSRRLKRGLSAFLLRVMRPPYYDEVKCYGTK